MRLWSIAKAVFGSRAQGQSQRQNWGDFTHQKECSGKSALALKLPNHSLYIFSLTGNSAESTVSISRVFFGSLGRSFMGGPSMSFPVQCHWRHRRQPITTTMNMKTSEHSVKVTVLWRPCPCPVGLSIFGVGNSAQAGAFLNSHRRLWLRRSLSLKANMFPFGGVTLKPCPCRRPIWNQPELDTHQKVAGPSKDLRRLVASTKLSIQWFALICTGFEFLNSQRPAKVW